MGSNDLSGVTVDGFQSEEDDMSRKPKRQTGKQEWVDPRVNPEPINPKNPSQTTQEFMDEIASKIAESLGVPSDLPDYESPSYSQAREYAKASQGADEKLDPIREMVASIKQEQHDRLIACIPKEGKLHSEPSGEGHPSSSVLTYDPWTDTVSRVVRTDKTGKVVEDYKPIPREDEARPCALCESRRPIGKSYSRVYCTKANVRYCKCSYCGHTWTQERK